MLDVTQIKEWKKSQKVGCNFWKRERKCRIKPIHLIQNEERTKRKRPTACQRNFNLNVTITYYNCICKQYLYNLIITCGTNKRKEILLCPENLSTIYFVIIADSGLLDLSLVDINNTC